MFGSGEWHTDDGRNVIYTDTHSWITWSTSDDIALLAEARVSVAHYPTPFACCGAILESFGGYRAAGINLGIGTDTTPQNMLDEMRWACVLGKVADANLDAVMTAACSKPRPRAVRVRWNATTSGASLWVPRLWPAPKRWSTV